MKKLLTFCLMLLSFEVAAQELQTLQRGSFKQILAAHTGKPFIVAMWSVSCTHCSADMELFRKLAQKNPEFRLVLISTDAPEQQPQISAMLEKFRLNDNEKLQGRIESWVYADTFSERLRYEIDPRWYGELPRTYFIDASGKARGVSGVLDEQATAHWLQEGK